MNVSESSPDLITERARVLRLQGGVAWVRCESQAGCERCAAGQGCGGGLFARLLRGRLQELPVETGLPLRPGDWVMIGLPVSAVQNASFLLYGLPLAGLLLGALLGNSLGSSLGGSQPAGHDLATLAGMIAGFVVGLSLVRRFAAVVGRRAGLHPVLLHQLGEKEPCLPRRQARQ